MLELFFAARESWIKTNKQTKILVDMHFVVKSNFSSLDPVSSKSWLVLQQFTQQKLKVKSEKWNFHFYFLTKQTIPATPRVFKRGTPPECQPLANSSPPITTGPLLLLPPGLLLAGQCLPARTQLNGHFRDVQSGEQDGRGTSNLVKVAWVELPWSSWCWWWSGGSGWWPTW